MPENTLAGVQAALQSRVDGIEIDVRLTADGVPVLLHDATLERTAGDPREVSALTSVELRSTVRVQPRLDLPEAARHAVSEPQVVPSLAEVLDLVAGRAIVVIEVKQAGMHEQVAEAVRRARAAAWCWIWAFDPRVGIACRRALREVPVGLNTAPGILERFGFPDEPVNLCVSEGFAAVSWRHRTVDEALVRSAQRRGLATYCWTVNEPDDITRVWKAGVDAICTDFPDRVDAVLGRTP
ncbi:MAG: glycerophosphodiester phosphodiesterase [Dehalococcoidia bacterium]|nr:glycerophosphodiester phosphodiesterase [Dehalococcoidia bacterium]